MERPNTVSGLLDKRREISGQIEHHQRVLNGLIVDLDHVTTPSRLFDPDCDVALPKQFPPRHQAFRGEMQRFVLGALRAASAPITSLEIAIEVVKGRGLDPNDPRAVSLIRKRVGACLFSLKAKGIARDGRLPGRIRDGSWWLRPPQPGAPEVRQTALPGWAGMAISLEYQPEGFAVGSAFMPSTNVEAHDSATSD